MTVATPRDNPTVLVLGRDIRAFLTTIRSLGRAGIQVHVGMCPANDHALDSRYVTRFHQIPDYSEDPDRWLQSLLELISKHRFRLVIPTHDESVIPVQIHRDTLAQHCAVYALESRAFELSMDKIASSRLAEDLSINVPRQFEIDLQVSTPRLPDGISFPIVAKPPSSFAKDNLTQRREVIHLHSVPEMEAFVENHRSWGSALVQEYFSGIGAGVEVLALDGEVLTAFQHLRVHEPIDGGASSYRKSAALDPDLLLAAKKLIQALNYTGVAMIEFKINPVSGKWVFIEINARFWGSLPLAVSAGVDFPLYLYQMLVEGRRVFPQQYKVPVFSRNLQRDIYWFSDNLKARLRNRHSHATTPLHKVAGEFFNLLLFREHIDSFALDDPRPGINEFKDVVSIFGNKLSDTIRSRFYRLLPVRRFVSWKIRNRISQARSLLMVCYGNICRSPFAELQVKKICGESLDIRSSGFHAQVDRPSPPVAVRVASEFGIDLSHHRSSMLDKTLLDGSDVILVFDEKNRKMILERFPETKSRLSP